MKMKHKRLVKRIVAGIFALLMVYGSSFGNPFVFPFAIGFVLVQYLSWRLSDEPDSITSRSLALDYSVIAIIVISAITVFLSKPIIAFFIFVFAIPIHLSSITYFALRHFVGFLPFSPAL